MAATKAACEAVLRWCSASSFRAAGVEGAVIAEEAFSCIEWGCGPSAPLPAPPAGKGWPDWSRLGTRQLSAEDAIFYNDGLLLGVRALMGASNVAEKLQQFFDALVQTLVEARNEAPHSAHVFFASKPGNGNGPSTRLFLRVYAKVAVHASLPAALCVHPTTGALEGGCQRWLRCIFLPLVGPLRSRLARILGRALEVRADVVETRAAIVDRLTGKLHGREKLALDAALGTGSYDGCTPLLCKVLQFGVGGDSNP